NALHFFEIESNDHKIPQLVVHYNSITFITELELISKFYEEIESVIYETLDTLADNPVLKISTIGMPAQILSLDDVRDMRLKHRITSTDTNITKNLSVKEVIFLKERNNCTLYSYYVYNSGT